jgi:HK97 family phage major capsid protein
MSNVAGPDSLDGDLRAHLYRTWLETPHDELSFHWVMSLEWLNEIRRMEGSTGHPLHEPGLRVSAPEYLLGMPIEVREDGGVPHLERSEF